MGRSDLFLTFSNGKGDGEADIDQQPDKKASKGSRKSAAPFDLSELPLGMNHFSRT
jgi:hypothetical protein